MRNNHSHAKVIAALNMTFDGYCDHEVSVADEEIHQHYTDLLNCADTLLYGRITYQLMEDFWPSLVARPSGETSMDDFAMAIEGIQKIVFSHTLKTLQWSTAQLATDSFETTLSALKKQSGGDILIGSRSLIVAATNAKLVDEYQLNIQPILAGKGLPLFDHLNERTDLQLLRTKTFGCGAVLFYFKSPFAADPC